jgi:HD-GYP domain-containing protein (c-di-GMP phosphodiesterase class II)
VVVLANWQKISASEIQVGRELAWPVYDKDGTLLLSAGQKINSEMNLEQLLERGAYRLPNQQEYLKFQQERESIRFPDGTNPFHLFAEYTTRLKNVFMAIKENKQNAESRLIKLARDIQMFCLYDVNAALAVVHLPMEGCYTLCHPLQCTIISELVAERMEMASDEREILCAANLVANLSMCELQATLSQQTEPVSDQQFIQIRQHPEKTVEMLIAAGFRNPLLLEMILQHHERLDGSGYPFGLEGNEIIAGAKVMGVADTYAAMVCERVHSKPLAIKSVLRELFLQRSKLFDEQAALVLIKELGVYPVGSFVRLKNGDTAIVVSQTRDKSLAPMVKSIMDTNKRGYAQPFKRDTSEEPFVIEDCCRYENANKLNLSLLWDYV